MTFALQCRNAVDVIAVIENLFLNDAVSAYPPLVTFLVEHVIKEFYSRKQPRFLSDTFMGDCTTLLKKEFPVDDECVYCGKWTPRYVLRTVFALIQFQNMVELGTTMDRFLSCADFKKAYYDNDCFKSVEEEDLLLLVPFQIFVVAALRSMPDPSQKKALVLFIASSLSEGTVGTHETGGNQNDEVSRRVVICAQEAEAERTYRAGRTRPKVMLSEFVAYRDSERGGALIKSRRTIVDVPSNQSLLPLPQPSFQDPAQAHLPLLPAQLFSNLSVGSSQSHTAASMLLANTTPYCDTEFTASLMLPSVSTLKRKSKGPADKPAGSVKKAKSSLSLHQLASFQPSLSIAHPPIGVPSAPSKEEPALPFTLLSASLTQPQTVVLPSVISSLSPHPFPPSANLILPASMIVSDVEAEHFGDSLDYCHSPVGSVSPIDQLFHTCGGDGVVPLSSCDALSTASFAFTSAEACAVNNYGGDCFDFTDDESCSIFSRFDHLAGRVTSGPCYEWHDSAHFDENNGTWASVI